MNTPSPELIAYIGKELHAGVTAEAITQALLTAEWSRKDIEAALKANGVEYIISQPVVPTVVTAANTVSATSSIGPVVPILFALIIIVVLTGSYFVVYSKWKGVASTTQESLTETAQSSTTTISFPDFNTKVTKLLDLSPYNMEESKKLWSEVSYFQFDGNGWLASLPLTKTIESEAAFVIGLADGSVREVKKQFQISSNGAFLITSEEQWGPDKKSIQKKYTLSDSKTGQVIQSTPFVDKVYRFVATKDGDMHIVALQDKKLTWFHNETVIEQFPLSDAYISNQMTMEYLVNLGFGSEKSIIAFAKKATSGVSIRVVSEEGMFETTALWNYSYDPITEVGILAVDDAHKLLVSAFGNKYMHTYLNDMEVLKGINLKEIERYLKPPTQSGQSLLALSVDKDGLGENEGVAAGVMKDDGKKQPFVLILKSDGTFEEGKKYPAGSILDNLTYSNAGKHLYYTVEIGRIGEKDGLEYVVVDGKEEGPWEAVSPIKFSENGDYLYSASKSDRSTVVIRNGQPVLTISQRTYVTKDGEEIPTNNLDGFTLDDFAGISQNPTTGDPLFVLKKTTFYNDSSDSTSSRKSIISLGKMETKSKVLYQGKEIGMYDGNVGSANWGTDIFSSDGKHYAYLVASESSTTNALVIDGKELPIDGSILGAWSGKSGGFSSDSNWFGLYIMKNNMVWWTPYNLNDPHEIKIPS